MAQLAALGWRFYLSSDLLATSREEAFSAGSALAESAPTALYLSGFNFWYGHRVAPDQQGGVADNFGELAQWCCFGVLLSKNPRQTIDILCSTQRRPH
jgi:hypothetical protein